MRTWLLVTSILALLVVVVWTSPTSVTGRDVSPANEGLLVSPTPTPTPTGPGLVLSPETRTVHLNEIFTFDIVAEAGDVPVDGAQAVITFNNIDFVVVDAAGAPTATIIAGTAFQQELANQADNAAGQIIYAAGQLTQSPLTGRITLATIRLKALGGLPAPIVSLRFVTQGAPRSSITSSGANVLAYTRDAAIAVIGPSPTPTATPTVSPTATPTAGINTPWLGFYPQAAVGLVNQMLIVDIVVNAGSQLVDGAQAVLTFNPAYLAVVDETGNPAATIIDGTAFQQPLANQADNAAGRIIYAAGQLTQPPLTGYLTLASIRFKAIAVTSGTPLHYVTEGAPRSSITANGGNVLAATIDGSITVYAVGPSHTATPTGVSTPSPTVTPTADPTATFTPTGTNTPSPTPVSIPAIVIAPAATAVALNDIFTLDIVVVAGSQLVDGAQAFMTFDPAYLVVVDAGGNPTNTIMAGGALETPLYNTTNNISGTILYAAGQLTQPAISGTFTLATIRFKALTATTGALVHVGSQGAWRSDLTYNGASVLRGTSDGWVTIAAPTLTPTATPTYTATGTATATPTICPMATPEPLWVDPVLSPTNLYTQTITVYIGHGEAVTVSAESGVWAAYGDFGASINPARVDIQLLPNTTHHLTVQAQVRRTEVGGCPYGGYVLTTTRDRYGAPLDIVQSAFTRPYRVWAPVVIVD